MIKTKLIKLLGGYTEEEYFVVSGLKEYNEAETPILLKSCINVTDEELKEVDTKKIKRLLLDNILSCDEVLGNIEIKQKHSRINKKTIFTMMLFVIPRS